MFSTVQLPILIAAIAGSGVMVGVLAWLVGRLLEGRPADEPLPAESPEPGRDG